MSHLPDHTRRKLLPLEVHGTSSVMLSKGDHEEHNELTFVSVNLCACENGNIVCSDTGED